MKILAIRFQNLNSLKGLHEISFNVSPLAEAGLFAITGPTGAGKTTILDAITVGLYGLVHRHENKSPIELLTRHTAEAFSEVEFESNGKQYRSKWSLRKSRGKVDGKLQQPAMELSDLGTGEFIETKLSLVPKAVEQVCGLSYQQFLRSVMLSQGDFAMFLKADKNDRSGLLEKITDTGIYSEISRFAYRKSNLELNKLEQLKQKLDYSQLLTEEQLEAHQNAIAELKQQEQALLVETATLRQQLQWKEKMAELCTKAERQAKNLEHHQAKLQQLEPDFTRLQQHEKARHYAGELTEIKSVNGKLVEVQEQLTTLTKQLPLLQTELEVATKTATESEVRHRELELALKQLEPVLNKVGKLDHELQTVREQFQKGRAEYEKFEVALTADDSKLQFQKQELVQITEQATGLKNWLQEHARFKELREHLPEFRQTLRDLQEVEQQRNRYCQEKSKLQGQSKQEREQLLKLKEAQEQNENLQRDLLLQRKTQLEKLQAVLASETLEELETNFQAQPAREARFIRLAELAQQYKVLEQKLLSLQLQAEEEEKNTDLLQVQLQETELKYKDATDHLKTLQELVELKQRIQEYEEARLNLEKDKPCPLCGSAHHPYAENNYTIDLPEEVQKRERQLELTVSLQQNIAQLQVKLQTLQQKQVLAKQVTSETEAEMARLTKAYQQSAGDVPIVITEPDKLAELLSNQKETQSQLQQKLVQARSYSREAESMLQRLQQLRDQDAKAVAGRSQLEQSEKYLQAQLLQLEANLQDVAEQRQAHTETASSFAATFSFSYKEESRTELLQTLEQKATDYQQKQQELDQLRVKYAELSTAVKHLQHVVTEKQQELATRKENLKETHTLLIKLKAERTGLFGDKDPVQERQTLQLQLNASANQAEQARALLQRKQHELVNQRNKQQECQQTHQKNISLLEELRVGLLSVLKQQGIDTIEGLTQMLLDREEADRLANLKSQEEKLLTALQKSLADVQHDLEETKRQRLTEDATETLELLLKDKAERQRMLISDKARIEQTLENDEAQREKFKEVALQLQIQQQICTRWSQLSDLIGSSEGHKFSRFAQGLTLAKLVQLANRHLQKLNERYRILKSEDDELELHIIDTYQADTVRPMNSLSGGESFLVSLALALGLSDLAGKKTQIKSLFIDEGFGTLDADTLDAAISTLESLQASGKMIGIISHVEALKDRISTQIKVVKQAGGVSKVKITTSGNQ